VIEDKTDIGIILGMEATGRTSFTLQENGIRIILVIHAISHVIHVWLEN